MGEFTSCGVGDGRDVKREEIDLTEDDEEEDNDEDTREEATDMERNELEEGMRCFSLDGAFRFCSSFLFCFLTLLLVLHAGPYESESAN